MLLVVSFTLLYYCCKYVNTFPVLHSCDCNFSALWEFVFIWNYKPVLLITFPTKINFFTTIVCNGTSTIDFKHVRVFTYGLSRVSVFICLYIFVVLAPLCTIWHYSTSSLITVNHSASPSNIMHHDDLALF